MAVFMGYMACHNKINLAYHENKGFFKLQSGISNVLKTTSPIQTYCY